MAPSAASASLELREPEGAFRRIEEWLRARGFFAPGEEELVADLYVGYGLSEAIRRTRTPAPPEPCPALPLTACSVRPGAYPVGRDDNGEALEDPPDVASSFGFGAWERTWSETEYEAAVDRVRAAIERGDAYQVNLVQHLSAPCPGSPREVARTLAAALAPLKPLRPEPFVGDAWAVVSASPELFLARPGGRVWTMPIKARDRLATPPSSAAPRRTQPST